MKTLIPTTIVQDLGSLDATNDLHLTAIHEAGHTVAYYKLGREVISVSIQSAEEHRGLTLPVPAMIDDIDRAQVLVAGPVAQAMATLAAAEPDEWGTDEQEIWADHAAGALMSGGQGDIEDFPVSFTDRGAAFDMWADVVRLQLTALWTPLIALAEALVARETLTGAEAFAVLDGALPADHDLLRR
ncbi:hypothetical protein [Arthrobacter sp. STN4]|uniref:hypothetical protein n=1 Tax=Arthrobacter sp. STN4 TaxID=2923276 RepID=UPI00211A4821|nr:hypothetical protein [Arthrobacter sp. STN4]MCQ9162996.1 hypothetical protein [Arthrobacter sp. STN4]